MEAYTNLSLIHRANKIISRNSIFEEKLNLLLEKYDIRKAIFGLDRQHNLVEITEGYFIPYHIDINLSNAIKRADRDDYAVLIESQGNNYTYTLGRISDTISSKKCIDCSSLKEI